MVVTFLTLTLCLLYRLSLGPLPLLRYHILHAQTLLITADLFDSGYDSFLLPILGIRTMISSYDSSYLTWWLPSRY
jgi:hypothetical protein